MKGKLIVFRENSTPGARSHIYVPTLRATLPPDLYPNCESQGVFESGKSGHNDAKATTSNSTTPNKFFKEWNYNLWGFEKRSMQNPCWEEKMIKNIKTLWKLMIRVSIPLFSERRPGFGNLLIKPKMHNYNKRSYNNFGFIDFALFCDWQWRTEISLKMKLHWIDSIK